MRSVSSISMSSVGVVAITLASIGAVSIGAGGSITTAAPAFGDVSRDPDSGARSPVVVELFTAEGCSSCPPADAMLARLVKEQPMPGVEIIALGFHVDYWDELGWRDRFASPAYTARQNRYAEAWQKARIYTPQLVVDGGAELVGSDWPAASRAIGAAAASPKLAVTLAHDATKATDERRLALKVDVQPQSALAGKADVFLAITEDDLVSDVLRGENQAKQLSHVAVVRSFDRLGGLEGSQPFAVTRSASLGRGWVRERVRAIVLVQDVKSRRVIGAAALRP